MLVTQPDTSNQPLGLQALWDSKLVLITQRAASKCAFLKRRLDRSENTNSEFELNTISKRMDNRFCNVQLCHSS